MTKNADSARLLDSLSPRAIDALGRGGIIEWWQLTQKTEQEVASIVGLGRKTMQELRRAVAASGRCFREVDQDRAELVEENRALRSEMAAMASAARRFCRRHEMQTEMDTKDSSSRGRPRGAGL